MVQRTYKFLYRLIDLRFVLELADHLSTNEVDPGSIRDKLNIHSNDTGEQNRILKNMSPGWADEDYDKINFKLRSKIELFRQIMG
jgi:hypothetical protein